MTADHVNPERPWPDLDRLRDGHRGARLHAGAAPHDLPRARPRAGALARPGAALPGARPLPTPRGSAATTPAPTSRSASAAPATPATAPRSSSSATGRPPGTPARRSARRRSCPPADAARPRPAARWPRCSPACALGQEPGIDELVTLFEARGPEVAAVAELADELRRDDRRRHRHVGPQPQHQLHQRVHVQVPVLRVLQGPAVAEPPRHAVPADARRHRRHASPRRGTAAPPRSRCRAASTRASTATTTST